MDANYSPSGKLLWDCWLIKVNNEFHVFYLQAIPTENSDDRHDNAVSIGHAVSDDLTHWKELPTALEKGDADAWDNLALWTGCVIEKDKQYFMFYTGRNKNADKKWIQKIGLAVSDDLISWKKITQNPILEANGFYPIDNRKNKLNKIGAWRDPFVFFDDESKKYFMTITARDKKFGREFNGCAALAESTDLLNWKLLPPIFSPGIYDEIETTQLIYHKGFYYLFFSTQASNYHPDFADKRGSFSGLHCYYSENIYGDYRPVNENGVVLGNGDDLYAVRLLHDNEDDFFAIGWLNGEKNKKIIGELSLPFKIRIEKNLVYKV